MNRVQIGDYLIELRTEAQLAAQAKAEATQPIGRADAIETTQLPVMSVPAPCGADGWRDVARYHTTPAVAEETEAAPGRALGPPRGCVAQLRW